MKIDRQIIDRWIEDARAAGIIGPAGFNTEAMARAGQKAAGLLYPQSVKPLDGAVFALLKMPGVSRDAPAFA